MGRKTAAVLSLVAALALASVALADTITGTDANDALTGTAGDDAIYGRAGNDTILGAAGDDTLDGGAGADDLAGGAGQDTVAYAAAPAGVAVTLDDVANDGSPGEGDNVHADVEDVYGGQLADTLTGSDTANTLDGGEGGDLLTGGGGTDGLYGGPGDDTIDAFDGKVDTVDCGPGNDTVVVFPADLVSNCERRRDPPATDASISHQERIAPSFTTFLRFDIEELKPDEATVQVLCKGRGCPFQRRVFKPGRDRVRLGRHLRGRRLQVGTVLEIRVVAPGVLGRVVRYTVRPRVLKRKRLCIFFGAARATKCP